MCWIGAPRAVLLVGMALLLAGCGGDPNARQAVSGVVYLKETPLDQGRIHFTPMERGPSESGAVIANGKFDIPRDRGLVPGKYKVAVFSYDEKGAKVPSEDIPGETGATQFRERIAAKYNAQTVLTADVVSGGPNSFEFKVE